MVFHITLFAFQTCFFPYPAAQNQNIVVPIITISGKQHELKDNQYCVINSVEQAQEIFGKCFGVDDFLRAPTVDYTSYTLIAVFYKKTLLLSSLHMATIEANDRRMIVKYIEGSTQSFTVPSEAPSSCAYLLLVVPKWEKDVAFLASDRAAPTATSNWQTKAYIRSKVQK